MLAEASDNFTSLINNLQADEEELKELPEELPILPVRNSVLFPNIIIPVTVTRQKAIKLIRKVYKGNRIVGVVTQKNHNAEDPTLEDLYSVGTVAYIMKMIGLPNEQNTIIIQGKQKFQINEIVRHSPYLVGKVTYLNDEPLEERRKDIKVLVQSLKEAAYKIMRLNPDIPQEAEVAIHNIENPTFLIHFLSANINVEVKEKQELLEIPSVKERGTKLLSHMLREIELLQIKQEIHTKAHSDIDQQQRDYFLRQQIKVLQDELGMDGHEQEIEQLRARGAQKKWPEAVAKHFNKELDKALRLNPQSPEFPVALNYAEFMVDLPWNEYSEDVFDLKKAQEILDQDHYGLEKAKQRIIEYLAVLKLKGGDMRGPILCFYGPPGVGKTSLGRSIAKALGRKYVRMSLGGLHDEAEIRGHRKTYIGAMPGRILQNIKKAGASNPVFILDEIDKVGSDFRGDPASALLEVLDPEQNNAFMDNYLEVEYDLSKVMFIATANSLDTIHPALRDRMEIIEITGYTQEEKVEIAKRHLLPKLRKEHGLKARDFSIDDKALLKIIEEYTRESGVRNLEQKLGAVMRHIAKWVAMEEPYKKRIKAEDIETILGPPIFDREIYQQNDIAGVVIGLAWTPVGGEILFVEASLSKGKGALTLSGQLGEVMKESAVTALSYLKAHAEELGIDHRIFSQYDLHIHVPAGAVPKDGPSAGITMLTALASIYTQRKVKERLAMTGEITLRGKVLPVGGIKEKLLAARRAGISEVILSIRNRKDVEEIDTQYLKDLHIHYVDTIDQVLQIALLPEKVKKPMHFDLEPIGKNQDQAREENLLSDSR
ncbi:MAG: endopeptidase La [Cytophagales bacterium]|nr:endopeptidase La [Bernardetiaceae bacterium]MDW8210652.1 endopeptidase La [Cytophagales bacterium]